MRRLFPHPILSVLLVVTWLLLVNEFRWGSLVFGMILGVLIPLFIKPYWPYRSTLKSLPKYIAYIGLVFWDIIVANVQVAKIVLFKPNSQLKPAWIVIPLEVRSAEAITVLAGTITLTPGTVSSALSDDRRHLLVHVLHLEDADAVIAHIKNRYEKPLMEIFP